MEPQPYTLTFSYDELMFLALALEHFAGNLRASFADALAPDARAQLDEQIARADALLGRLNESRR